MTPSQRAATVEPHLVLRGNPLLLLPDGSTRRLGRRALGLLTLVALASPLTRARAASMLYPDLNDAGARRNLRQMLFSQRALLDPLVEQRGDLLVLRRGVQVDALSDPADTDLGAPFVPLLQDLSFDELPVFQDWLGEARERAAQVYRERLVAAASAHEAAGELARALTLAQRLAAESPASEHAHRRLMRLHYLRGDRAAALAAFDRCEQVLKDELSARPEPETLALLRQIESAELLRPAGPRPVPPTVLRPPRLVGRQAEWASLKLAWDEGECAAVLGDAGMGKSRLLSDFARAFAAGGEQRLIAVGARPGDARVPYALLGRTLRMVLAGARATPLAAGVRRELARLLPELGDPPQGRNPAAGARLMNAIEQVLDQARAAGLQALLLDDLHLADAASVEAVGHLASAGGLRWIVAARGSETQGPAARLIGSWIDGRRARRVDLAPLDVEAIAELLETLAVDGIDRHQAPGLWRRTGGNPMFVLETLKGWLSQGMPGGDMQRSGQPVAASVRHAIEQRMSRLSADAVRLARCAAVAGQDFSAELASQVLGVRPLDLSDSWAELEAAQVLRDGAFAHDLVWEATLASVPAPIARQLHRDIARFLQDQRAEPARLALHWEQAQAWPEAGAAAMQAAAHASARARPAEQAAWLEQAGAAFDKAGDQERRFEALIQRVWAASLVDLGATAQAALADAEGAAGTDEQRLSLLAARAELATERGDPVGAELVEQGLLRAQAGGFKELAVRFALLKADWLCETRRASEAALLLQPLQPWVDAHANGRSRCQFAMALAIAYDYANRLDEALPLWDLAIEQGRAADLPALLGQAISNKAGTLAKTGRVEQAVALGRQGLELMVDEEGATSRAMKTRCSLGHRLRDIGHFDQALELLEPARAAFETAGIAFWTHSCEHRLAHLWLQLGQPARAGPLLDKDLREQPLTLRMLRLVHRADLARQLGSDALTPIREALTMMSKRQDDIYYRIAVLFACGIVPAAQAEVLAQGLTVWAHGCQRHGLAMSGHTCAAAAALAQADAARALPHVRASLALVREFTPDTFYLPRVWLTAARVFSALDRAEEACRAVQDGREWVLRVAAEHVPAPFRDSFLERNAVNRDLLLLAAKLSHAQAR